MAKKKISEFYQMTQSFFRVYLPSQRNPSEHTIRAYQKPIDQLAEFVAARRNVCLWDVDFPLIDSTILSEFLDPLEGFGNSIATRNQRLKGIRAFYPYAAMMRPVLMDHRAEIYKIPFKKETSEQVVDHLSEDATKALLGMPDAGTKKGLRDQFLLIFLYDSAARVQETADVKLKDIHTGKTPVVVLHGKGDKIRTVPLMEKTMGFTQTGPSFIQSEAALKTASVRVPSARCLDGMARLLKRLFPKLKVPSTRIFCATAGPCTFTSMAWTLH